MPTPPRRARFQIHLSTAIVLMFVAGGLIWMNVSPFNDFRATEDGDTCYGWPLTAMATWSDAVYFSPFGAQNPRTHWFTGMIAADALFGIAILFAVFSVFEYVIYRKRLRIHLSTAIVLMFTAGVMIWVNTIARIVPPSDFITSQGDVQKGWGFTMAHYGWPFAFLKRPLFSLAAKSVDWDSVVVDQLVADVVVASGLLLGVCIFCEWLIRWRAARKGA